MAKLKIVIEPNELLRKRSKEVTDFSSRLHELLDDMAETMRSGGVGIAAVQVGVLWRACIVDANDGVCELVNPVIVSSGKQKSGEEGCLSIPHVSGNVMRPQEVTVNFFDRNGEAQTKTFKGRDAVCACHELDHLDGILFTDKIEKKGERK